MANMRRIETLRRIREEYMDLNRNPILNLGVGVGLPNEDDIFNWKISVIAPRDTPYMGGVFLILLHFPDNYPNAHPEIRFKTPIYHLNVNPRAMPNNNNLGDICLSVLNFWKPEYKIKDVLVSIYALFYMVNPDSPYGFDRRDEYINNKILYEEKVRYFTRKYANPSNNNIDREYNEVWDFSFHP